MGVVLLGAIGIWAGVRVALNTEFPILVVSSGSMCQRAENSSVDRCSLPIGALIVVRGQDPGTIVPSTVTTPGAEPNGSIIVFSPPVSYSSDLNYLVVHRVVGEKLTSSGYVFYTRGDANGGACNCAAGDDTWDQSKGGPGVPASNIVGVYQYTVPVPYLGSTILDIRSFMYDGTTGQLRPEGLAVIVLLIGALIVFEVVEPSKKKSRPLTASPPATET